MTSRGLLIPLLLGGAFAATAPAIAAQPAPDALGALLAEVRALRLAIERQTAMTARAQLLIGRLTLQDQRVARTRSELARADAEASNLGGERARLHDVAREMQQSLDGASDPAHRGSLETELRLARGQLARVEASLAEIETRRAQLGQALEAERARWDELQGWFDQLERELDRASR